MSSKAHLQLSLSSSLPEHTLSRPIHVDTKGSTLPLPPFPIPPIPQLASPIPRPRPADYSTANTYSAGESEVILGKALKVIGAPRESVVVLTKVYNPVNGKELEGRPESLREGRGFVNEQGLSRKVRLGRSLWR